MSELLFKGAQIGETEKGDSRMTKEMFVQFSKKAAVNEVMKKTGMSKKRAVKAVEELEREGVLFYMGNGTVMMGV